jgi:hypothetical protein
MLWAPYDRGAHASTARDTQRHATPPEPVPLHNISSTSSCVYSNNNVHMYTLNKVSTPLPLVLITSYCVVTSTMHYLNTIYKEVKVKPLSINDTVLSL